MHFSPLLDSMSNQDGVWTVTVPDDWMQGRSVYGGLQSAIALRAMRSLVPPDVPLRVLQTTFVAPVPAGRMRLSAAVLRTGKNVTHVEARILSDDGTAAIVVGAFGRARTSRVRLIPRLTLASPPPLDDPPAHSAPLHFAQHFMARWLDGDRPGSSTERADTLIQVGLRDSGPMGAEHVVAIADAVPPVALSFLDHFAPGSSLTWTIEMVRDRFDDCSLKGWLLRSELSAARDGYTSQTVSVCDPTGELVALSRQTMVVFG